MGMPIDRRQFALGMAALAAAAGLPRGAGAQGATLDTARIITGFPPGGTSDVTCRRVAERLRGGYARNVLVDNRTGAGGQIAVRAMKGAATDGSMILQTPASMLMIYPYIYKDLPYDPLTDLMPVTRACTFDFGFAVGPAVPEAVRTLAQFLDWCRAEPARASYGSPAAGSVPHFIGVLLGRAAGIDLRHAAYRGTQPAIQDMVAGQLPAVSGPIGEFTQMVAAGKARLLAASGTRRSRFAPDVPTYAEQGFANLVFSEWFGFFLPAGSPADVVGRAHGALSAALASADVVDGLAVMGLEAAASSPVELGEILRRDHGRWGPIVKEIGFTADT